MATHTSDWYATTGTTRPQGAAGTYEGKVSGTKFEVVIDRDGLIWQHTSSTGFWVPMRGWDADRFEPDVEVLPDWVEECTHTPVCTVERDCDALHREQGDGSW